MQKTLLMDLDKCITPFNPQPGTDRVTELLKVKFGAKGEEIGFLFGKIFHLLDDLHHSKKTSEAIDYQTKINLYKVQTKYPNLSFMWSREIWLKHLSDTNNIKLTDEQIMHLIDEYWKAIAKGNQIYPEAYLYLINLKIPKFIITGSDRNLILKDNKIIFDPEFSANRKIKRAKAQGISSLFDDSQIITGDPIDKPKKQFWEKVIKITKIKNPEDGIVVDDSLNVVKSAVTFGFKGYLLDRENHYDAQEVKDKVDGYLTQLNKLRIE